MEGGELFSVLFLLVGLYFSAAAEVSKNFQRDENQAIVFANFQMHSSRRLLAPFSMNSTTKQESSSGCAHSCLQQSWCWSYNFQRTPDKDNKYMCEVLSIDKYNNSDGFRPSAVFDHFSIMNPCARSPCKNGGRCVALYEKNDFLCVCPEQFQGRYCAVKLLSTCKDIFRVRGERENKAYPLLVDSGQTQVYCHMSDISGCDGGGWTLVMKIDGSKTTFSYDSSYWSQKNTFNLAGGLTGGDNNEETKLPTYWNTSFTKICLGMKVGANSRFILLQKNAPSLHSLIAGGNFQATSLTRDTWKSLISSSSMQLNCNKEGFNTGPDDAQSQSDAKARIGYIANQEGDCNTPDSVIGFGMGDYPFGKSCGNGARNINADNGEQNIAAMCFIFVQ